MPEDETTTETTETEQADTTDWKAEAEKWQALSRKHEDRSKANSQAARDLEALRKSQMSDQEKAVADARAEARSEALREVGGRVVGAEFRAAAAGRTVNGKPLDVSALVEGLNLSYYLTDTGEVDTDKVTRYLDGIAPKPDKGDAAGNGQRFPDLGQGRRPTSKVSGREAGLAEAQRRFPQTKLTQP